MGFLMGFKSFYYPKVLCKIEEVPKALKLQMK